MSNYDYEYNDDITPDLVDSLGQQESAGGKYLVGPETRYGQALGPYQFLQSTFDQYKQDPEADIMTDEGSRPAVVAMLNDLNSHYGDVPLSLAAYNWGRGNVDKALARARNRGLPATFETISQFDDFPEQTRKYVPQILGRLEGNPTTELKAVQKKKFSAGEDDTGNDYLMADWTGEQQTADTQVAQETTTPTTPSNTYNFADLNPFSEQEASAEEPVAQQLTQLSPEDEQKFQAWYKEQAAKTHLNPNPDDPRHFYDYRAAYKAGVSGPDSTGHWPSAYKLEGHPRRYINGVDTKTGEYVGNVQGNLTEPTAQSFISEDTPQLPPIKPFYGDGTVDDFKAKMLEQTTSPAWGLASPYEKADQLNKMFYAGSWDPKAREIAKAGATHMWNTVPLEQAPNFQGLVNSFGGVPVLPAETKNPKQTLDQWEVNLRQSMQERGIVPEVFGQQFDDYLRKAKDAELEGFANRNRGPWADAAQTEWAYTKKIAAGVGESVLALPAAVSRFGLGTVAPEWGYEGAEWLEGLPKRIEGLAFEDPQRQLAMQDATGHVMVDEDGNPIPNSPRAQKIVDLGANIAGMFTLAGSAKIFSVLGKAGEVAAVLGSQTAVGMNSAFHEAKQEGGSDNEAWTAGMLSIPGAAGGAVATSFIAGGAPAVIEGMSLPQQMVNIASWATKEIALKEAPAMVGQQLWQSTAASIALGKNVVTVDKLEEAYVAGLLGGAVGKGISARSDIMQSDFVQRQLQTLRGFKDSVIPKTGTEITLPTEEPPANTQAPAAPAPGTSTVVVRNLSRQEQKQLGSKVQGFLSSDAEQLNLSYEEAAHLPEFLVTNAGVEVSKNGDQVLLTKKKTYTYLEPETMQTIEQLDSSIESVQGYLADHPASGSEADIIKEYLKAKEDLETAHAVHGSEYEEGFNKYQELRSNYEQEQKAYEHAVTSEDDLRIKNARLARDTAQKELDVHTKAWESRNSAAWSELHDMDLRLEKLQQWRDLIYGGANKKYPNKRAYGVIGNDIKNAERNLQFLLKKREELYAQEKTRTVEQAIMPRVGDSMPINRKRRLLLNNSKLSNIPDDVDFSRGVPVEGKIVMPHNGKWYITDRAGNFQNERYGSFFEAVRALEPSPPMREEMPDILANLNAEIKTKESDLAKHPLPGTENAVMNRYDELRSKVPTEGQVAGPELLSAIEDYNKFKTEYEAVRGELTEARLTGDAERIKQAENALLDAGDILAKAKGVKRLAEAKKALDEITPYRNMTYNRPGEAGVFAKNRALIESDLNTLRLRKARLEKVAAKYETPAKAAVRATVELSPEAAVTPERLQPEAAVSREAPKTVEPEAKRSPKGVALSAESKARLMLSRAAKPLNSTDWTSEHDYTEMGQVQLRGTRAPAFDKTGKTQVTTKQILSAIHSFAKALDPYYKILYGGKMPPHVLGYFNYLKKLTKVGNFAGVQTLVHEAVGHLVDAKAISFWDNLNRPDYSKVPPNVRAALVDMYETFYPANGLPLNSQMKEGVAMFMQHYVTSQPVRRELLDWFHNQYSKENPEVYKGIESLKKLAYDYYNQTEDLFFQGWKQRPETKLQKAVRNSQPGKWIADKWADMAHVLYEINPATHKEHEVNQFRADIYSKQWVGGNRLNDTDGNVQTATGLDLSNVRTPAQIYDELPKEKHEAFTDGLLSARTLKVIYSGREPGMNFQDAKARYDHALQDPEIRRAMQKYYDWNHALNEVLASTSPDAKYAIASMQKKNIEAVQGTHLETDFMNGPEAGYWVPFQRENMGGVKSHKEFKGSTRPPIDPRYTLENAVRGLFRNAFTRRDLYNLYRDATEISANPIGGYIREVHMNDIMNGLHEQMQKRIESVDGKKYTGEDGEMQDGLVNFMQPWYDHPDVDVAKNSKYKYFSVRDEAGKIRFFETDPRVYKAVQGGLPQWFQTVINNPIGRALLVTPGRLLRPMATSYQMTFQFKQMMRDPVTAWRWLETSGMGAGDLAKIYTYMFSSLKEQALFHTGKGDATWFSLVNRLGMGHMSKIGTDTALFKEVAGSKPGLLLGYGTRAMDIAEAVGSGPELATRAAVMRMVAEKIGITDPNQQLTHLQAIELISAFQRSTTNFGRQGEYAKAINVMVPFFSARIAELTRLPDDFRRDRTKMLGVAATAMTLGLWHALAHNDERWYKEMAPDQKMNTAWFSVDAGNGLRKVMGVPLDSWTASGWGVGAMVGNAMQKDPHLSLGLVQLAKAYFGQNVVPVNNPEELAGVVGKEVMAQYANKDFFTGRSIEPAALQYKSKPQRYTEMTTEFSKYVGKLMSWSPVRIDHVLQNSAPAAYRTLGWTERATGIKPSTDEAYQSFWANSLYNAFPTRSGSTNSLADISSQNFQNALLESRENKWQETPQESEVRKKLEKINKGVSAISTLLTVSDIPQDMREELKQKKLDLFTAGIEVARGERGATPNASGYEKSADKVRKSRASKEKSSALAARGFDLRGSTLETSD